MSVTAAIARGLSSPAEVASPAELSIGPERAGARIEFASRWGRGAVGPLHPSRARWGRAAAGPPNTRCVANFYSPRGLRAKCPELMRPHVRTYARGCAHAHVRMRAVAHARHERTYVRTSSTHARTYVRAHARTGSLARAQGTRTSAERARTCAHAHWHMRKTSARPRNLLIAISGSRGARIAQPAISSSATYVQRTYLLASLAATASFGCQPVLWVASPKRCHCPERRSVQLSLTRRG